MGARSRRPRLFVLIKGKQPRQDFGEGVIGVRGNKVWLNHAGEVGLRHSGRLANHVQIAGMHIRPSDSSWLPLALLRDSEQTHKSLGIDRLPSDLWSSNFSTGGSVRDEDYTAFPDEKLARTHAQIMGDHGRKSSLFRGLAEAFQQAHHERDGVIVVHPHIHSSLMATRDTLRHEDTHQSLSSVIPNWESNLFGQGDVAEQLLKDTDIRDAVHNLTRSYGENPRVLQNELIARLGNSDGLRDLRLSPDSDKYFRVLSKVLDTGVKHHGTDFYRIFEHSAPIYRDNFYAHVAGHQSHPDFGIGVSDVHRGKVFLTHDGKIGADHVGLSTDAQGKIGAERIPSLMDSLAKERDAPPYAVHQEPVQHTPGHPYHYGITPVTAASLLHSAKSMPHY